VDGRRLLDLNGDLRGFHNLSFGDQQFEDAMLVGGLNLNYLVVAKGTSGSYLSSLVCDLYFPLTGGRISFFLLLESIKP